ncbi:MAG TPA: DUF2256 domain-containing protein [Flavobacteriales bacterium]|nr:DUF2256 domain-containing protein [Flavobacteriales bacterium]HMR28780.1 DUF2256 domain-containing protein [Flavobacteriales bacterium]
MPRHRPPSERPTKTCATCGLPFQWRRKWEKVWHEVNHCSDRCRHERNRRKPA